MSPSDVPVPVPHRATSPAAPGLGQPPAGVSGFYFGRFCCKNSSCWSGKITETCLLWGCRWDTAPAPGLLARGGWSRRAGTHQGPFAGHHVHNVPAELKTGPETTLGGASTGASTPNLNVPGTISRSPFAGGFGGSVGGTAAGREAPTAPPLLLTSCFSVLVRFITLKNLAAWRLPTSPLDLHSLFQLLQPEE